MKSDISRVIIYLTCLGTVTYLGAVHVIAGDAVVGLIGAIAGYAAGRVVNGLGSG